jgi:mono/diheme cytochrome c family protein
MRTLTTIVAAVALLLAAPAAAQQKQPSEGAAPPKAPPGPGIGPGLTMPKMDAARGRQVFAAKGCVVCHSVNKVGGTDARPFDASTMSLPMNPFEFTARMWRGAEPMIALQRQELGGQIEITGQDLADIIAFVHDADEQKKFSEKDVPHNIMDLLSKSHPPGKSKEPHK